MTADEIRAAAIRYGERALANSRRRLGELGWTKHGAWVEDNVIELTKLWAVEESKGLHR